MDGIHDLGGMEGFGKIPIEVNEPVFHAEWEARAMAMRVLMGFWRKWNRICGFLDFGSPPGKRYRGYRTI